MIPLSDVFVEVKHFLEGLTINALETGCSFAWTPDNFNNLSTLNIAANLLRSDVDHLISVDNNTSNIVKCSQELKDRNLKHLVSFFNGESVDFLSDRVTRNLEGFNFFWLDSEENADHGLKEYELATELLIKPGVICIDDYGSNGSVKWRLSSEKLKLDSNVYRCYDTPTGLIVGFFNR